MKCQNCEKPATFHITELTDPEEVRELHLCEECARDYLSQQEDDVTPTNSVVGALAQQMKVGQTAEELARLDQRVCPACGITFYEFRSAGRLGCPHDYVCFEEELEPLILNIHGASEHRGKSSPHGAETSERHSRLISLRRELRECVGREEYEQASKLRDEMRRIEEERLEAPERPASASPPEAPPPRPKGRGRGKGGRRTSNPEGGDQEGGGQGGDADEATSEESPGP